MTTNTTQAAAIIEPTPAEAALEQQTPVLTVVKSEVQTQHLEAINLFEVQIAKGVDVTFPELISSLNNPLLLTAEHKKKIADMFDMTAKQVQGAIFKMQHSAPIVGALGRMPDNEYDFIGLQLAAWQTTMTFDEIFTIQTPYQLGDITCTQAELDALGASSERAQIMASDPKELTFKDISAKLIKTNAVLDLGYQERQIMNALDDWKNTEKNMIVGRIVSELVYDDRWDEKAEEEWSKFINAITAVNVEETKTVMKHFFWQVKRKMFNKPVTDHIMPVFFGQQGIGKSSIIQQICGPLKEFTASTDFAAITDNRSHGLWKNYILVFDEMGRSTITNIEDIKRRITEESFIGRILGTNNDTHVINKSTFVGSTNRDLGRLIFDDTGMRRFYQIDCLDKFDWTVTNSIDFKLLWRSIDENSPSKFKADRALYERIVAVQNSKRHITLVENFLLDRKYSATEEKLTATEFFTEFQAYELQHTPRNEKNSTNFGKEVMDTFARIPGLVIEKGRSNKGAIYKITYTKQIGC